MLNDNNDNKKAHRKVQLAMALLILAMSAVDAVFNNSFAVNSTLAIINQTNG